ncbi:Protein HIR1 [Candida viswanathii]|uniref:Protein HIR n=1 Tax=Candida viswanathii TaxID=5486 RepID=A0A367XNY5_9ASCO|nr:Protein HIR1 [Candida viswanathii]
MQILKIPWFGHKTENKKVECYTVTINNDGTRLASGGLDGNIKIWDLKTINLFFQMSDQPYKTKKDPVLTKLEESLPDKSLRRPLCSMSRHNGVVTSLKFSPDGRWLALGSDDKICLIWEKDNSQIPKQFGTEEQDLEHWTVRKRLVAHDNDIQDICWSPDGNLLVTVGLDRSIIIWNALTFERIKRYDVHQSMVKGIVFDPANKFFATASDDRTVRIFRYYKKLNEYNNYEFQMEHTVRDPFKKSPLTSYFRRMSWSPDGQHIAVPNAKNGPVPSVAIISRGNWSSDVSLIGHEAPVEVCAFSPRLFQIGEGGPDEEPQLQTIVATGGQDRTLAVWSTCNPRPLAVCLNIVDDSITDICWAPDGQTFYFSCLDGSIASVRFLEGELGKVMTEDWIDQQLNRYGADRESAVLPESVEQLQLEEKAKDIRAIALRRMMPLTDGSSIKLERSTLSLTPSKRETPTSQPLTTGTRASVDLNKLRNQTITITKSGKKRVAPMLLSSSTAAPTPVKPTIQPAMGVEKKRKLRSSSKMSQPNYIIPRLGIQTAVHGMKRKAEQTTQEVDNDDDNDNEDIGGENAASNAISVSDAALRRQKNRQKRKIMEKKYPHSFKLISDLPEGLFNNHALQNIEINKIYKTHGKLKDILAELSSGTAVEVDEDLVFAVVFRLFRHEQKENYVLEEAADEIRTTIEIRNGKPWNSDDEIAADRDFDDPTRVIVTNQNKEERVFSLFFPFRIQHVLPIIFDSALRFYVFCSFHGSIQIVTGATGTYACPTFELGESVVSMKHDGRGSLVVLTSGGLLYSWDLGSMRVKMQGVSIATILNNYKVEGKSVLAPNVRGLEINPKDGSPLILLDSSNDVYGYSFDLESWVKVLDSWYYLVDPKNEFDGALGSLANKLKLAFEDDKVAKRIYTYKFEEKNDLQDAMVARSKELIDLV